MRKPPLLAQRQHLGRHELGLRIVEHGDAMLELVRQSLATRIVSDQLLDALLVGHDTHAVDPDDAFGSLAQRHHRAGKAALVHEVIERDTRRRVERARRQRRSRPAGAEQPERIAHPIGVAPEPVQLSSVRHRLYGILPSNPPRMCAVRQRHLVAEQHRVAIASFAREPAQPLRNVVPRQPNLRHVPGPRDDPDPSEPEAIAFYRVPVAADGEVHLASHQPRLVERDAPRVVSDEAQIIDGAQLDQRNAASGVRVDRADFGIRAARRSIAGARCNHRAGGGQHDGTRDDHRNLATHPSLPQFNRPLECPSDRRACGAWKA